MKCRIAYVVFALLSARIALAAPTSFRVENRSTNPYTGVVDVVLPFAPGEVANVSEIQDFLADGRPTTVRPFKYHRNGSSTSIALARLTTTIQLNANESRTVALTRGSNQPSPFHVGSGIAALGVAVGEKLIIGASMNGQECYTSAFGPHEILHSDALNFTVRWRLHPVCADQSTLPISFTLYMRLGAGDDHAKMTLLVGNDTLSRPVSGGMAANVYLYVKDPVQVAFHQPQAHGGIPELSNVAGYRRFQLLNSSNVIADGVNVPFPLSVGVGSAQSVPVRSMRAAADNAGNQILGIVDYESFRSSHALGPLGVVPRPRFSTVAQGRAAVEVHCGSVPALGALDYKGFALQHPFITGDQGDIAANLPIFGLQVAQTGSLCPLKAAYVGVLGEFLRPSASSYWMLDEGVERRTDLMEYGDLMLWGDRVHQTGFYNATRHGDYLRRINTSTNTFVPGPSNYSPFDEEHTYHTSQLIMTEFTGDEVLLDLLKVKARSIFWNYFNWYRGPMLAAPRAYGRDGQAVLQMTSFLVSDPEIEIVHQAMLSKTRDVLRVVLNSNRTTDGYAHAGGGVVNSTGVYTRCLAGEFPTISPTPQSNCHAVYAWQHGFLLQAVTQAVLMEQEGAVARSILEDLLTEMPKYLVSGSVPVTYFLRLDPTIRDTGGIGSHWYAGWAIAASVMPHHPRSAEVLNSYAKDVLVPAVEGGPVRDTFWRTTDRFNVFEDGATLTFRGGASFTGGAESGGSSLKDGGSTGPGTAKKPKKGKRKPTKKKGRDRGVK